MLGLMEAYLDLDEAARPAWLASLARRDPKLKAGLLQLLMQHNALQEQDFLGTPAALKPSNAAVGADGLSAIGGREAIPAFAGPSDDDDATVGPWRSNERGAGHRAPEVIGVSGDWKTRAGDDTGPGAVPLGDRRGAAPAANEDSDATNGYVMRARRSPAAEPPGRVPPAGNVSRQRDPLPLGNRPNAPLGDSPPRGSRPSAPLGNSSPSDSLPDPPAANPHDLQEGDVLDGRYTLVAELGRGGMGTVYKATDANRVAFQDRHPYIALKLLGEEFRRHPDARMALQRETVRAQSLTHENIVRVHDFDYDGTYAYMTMELLEGRTLEDWLQDESSANAPLERRWAIICGVGAGLSCAHKNGVVHSDLKPGNIFLCKKGAVKVMDFGIARPLRAVAEEADTTRFDAAQRLGALTPAYASLEQINYEAPDPRDDIYAFACVVYYIFSGRHPFGRESAKRAMETRLVPQRIPSLTRLQWETLRRGLAFKRQDRIPSIDEFLRQFAPRTWWHKHRRLLGAAAIAVTGTSLFFGTQFYNDYVEDQAVNAQLWPRTDGPAPPLTADQKRDIDDFLYLSKINLQQAANAKSSEELSAILSKGDNNLLDLLKRIRSLEPANAQALQMTEQATRLYAERVRALLAAQKPEEAMRMLREGQNFRHTLGLFMLKRQICSAAPTACGIGQPGMPPG